MTDEIQFSNMDSWRGGSSGKFGLNFKQIILQHIQRCVINGSVEFCGGYWNETGNNPTIRNYIPDSRDVYNNSVKMLKALLKGYFDKQITTAYTEFKDEFSVKFKEFSEKEDKQKDVKYEWYNYRVNWHIELFEELIMLCKRLNFFEEETSEEEV